MLYNERAELILQQLQLQSTVKVNELSQLLQVSVDTVRRDLKAMEQAGLIKCLRGGACLPESHLSLSKAGNSGSLSAKISSFFTRGEHYQMVRVPQNKKP